MQFIHQDSSMRTATLAENVIKEITQFVEEGS